MLNIALIYYKNIYMKTLDVLYFILYKFFHFTIKNKLLKTIKLFNLLTMIYFKIKLIISLI
jgi:hypothetical protein